MIWKNLLLSALIAGILLVGAFGEMAEDYYESKVTRPQTVWLTLNFSTQRVIYKVWLCGKPLKKTIEIGRAHV